MVAEVVVVAESRPSGADAQVPPMPVVVLPRPSGDPIEDSLDLDDSSNQQLIEIAVALEMDTLENLDVIANLELLERWIALEEGAG